MMIDEWRVEDFFGTYDGGVMSWWQCEIVWDHEMNESETRFSQVDDEQILVSTKLVWTKDSEV